MFINFPSMEYSVFLFGQKYDNPIFIMKLAMSDGNPSPFPEPWNYLLSFITHFKKSIKVNQSPRVPRVRGGDPSGVAPEKVEGFFSAPGHPWKLFS